MTPIPTKVAIKVVKDDYHPKKLTAMAQGVEDHDVG